MAGQFYQLAVYVRPVQEAVQLSADFSPVSRGDAEENDAIDDFLDRQVQLTRGQGCVSGRHVPGQDMAASGQLGQEDTGLGWAALYPGGSGVLRALRSGHQTVPVHDGRSGRDHQRPYNRRSHCSGHVTVLTHQDNE